MGKGAGGGGSQTTTMNPWGGSIPSLKRGLTLNARLLDNRQLAPDAYGGPRVAGFRPEQMEGFRSLMGESRQLGAAGGLNDQSLGAVSGMLGAGNAGMTQQAGAQGLNAVMGDFQSGGDAPDVSLGGVQQGAGGAFGFMNHQLGRTAGDAQGDQAAIQRGGVGALGFINNALDGAQDRTYRDLDQVRQNVLGSVIPQVSSMFSDTGGLDSSAAMDTIGRAAGEAIAPIEYGAYNDAMNRNNANINNALGFSSGVYGDAMNRNIGNLNTAMGLSSGVMEGNVARDFAGQQNMLGRGMDAAGMGNDAVTRGLSLAPGVAGMQFLPGQMMQQVGGMQQGQRQNEINARMDQYNQNASRPYDNLARYMAISQGTAGLGGTSTQPYNGPSQGQQAIGGAMSGAASGAMIGGPYGALAGGGLGLLGAFL